MAQQTVTLDEVTAAATRLQEAGTQVTIETMRETLGAGSASTIHKHLSAWRASHAKPAEAPKPELPESIVADLERWVRQFAAESSAGARATLAQHESDLEALIEQVDSVTIARDQALATIHERDESVERLTISLNDARKIATDALVGKAKDQLAIEGKDAQLADLRLQLERNVTASATQSDARLAAEMELIGAATARDNFESELKDLRTQLAAAHAERGTLRAEVEALRARR